MSVLGVPAGQASGPHGCGVCTCVRMRSRAAAACVHPLCVRCAARGAEHGAVALLLRGSMVWSRSVWDCVLPFTMSRCSESGSVICSLSACFALCRFHDDASRVYADTQADTQGLPQSGQQGKNVILEGRLQGSRTGERVTIAQQRPRRSQQVGGCEGDSNEQICENWTDLLMYMYFGLYTSLNPFCIPSISPTRHPLFSPFHLKPIPMPFTVLITGSSTGLGADLCVQLARKFADGIVYASMRNLTDERSQPISALLKEAGVEDRVRFIDLDVVSEESTAAAVKKIIDETGQIDVVFVNAGYGTLGLLECIPDDNAKAMFEVNYFGALRTVRAVLPHMVKQRRGYLMFTSSVAAIRGYPLGVHYAATKAALEVAIESEAALYETRGIAFTLVEPGPVRTRFLDNVGVLPTAPPTASDPAWLNAATARADARLRERFEATQQECAEVVEGMVGMTAQWVDAHFAPTSVPFRMQTGPLVRDLASLKLRDLDGSVVQDMIGRPVWRGFEVE